MARAQTTGAESNDATIEQVSLAISGATVVIQSTVKRSGTYAYHCNSGAGGVTSYLGALAMSSSGASYVRFAIRVSTLPSSTVRICRPQASNANISVRLTSGGKLQLWNEVAASQIGSDSAATIAVDTWYRVELYWNEAGAGAVDDGELRLDDTTVASFTNLDLGTTSGTFQFGWVDSPGANRSLYVDDLCQNTTTGSDQNSWPGDGKIVLLLPISDSIRDALWTGGAGGTSNLFEAVNNTPPTGTASETDSTQIEHAGGAGGTTDDYEATMTTYSTAGLVSGDTVTVVQLLVAHGEDINTGTKVLSSEVLSNPAIASSGNFNAGNDAGALATYPSTWTIHRGTIAYAPSVTLGTSPVMRVRRPETANRVASVCFMGMLVEYAPPGVVDATGTIASGSLSVSGQSITGTGVAPATGTVATGSLTVSGQSITGTPISLGSVATGSHAVSGQSVAAVAGSIGTVAAGAHVVSGQAVAGQAGTLATVATGSHAVSGQAVTAQSGALATVAAGSHAVSGQAVAADAGTIGTVATGGLVVAGQTVTGTEGGAPETGTIATGGHAISGQSITAQVGAAGTVAAGAHVVSGQSVTGQAGALGTVATGSLTVSGQDVSATTGVANPAYRTKGTTHQFANTATVAPTVPTVSAGELLLCWISHRDGGVTISSFPSGWAYVPVQGGSANPAGGAGADACLMVAYKVADGTEGGTSPSYTMSAAGNGVAVITIYQNINSADPFDADIVSNVMGASATAVPVPNVTTTMNGALVIVGVGGDEEASSADMFTAWPASLAERVDAESGASNVFLGVADVPLSTAGEFNPSDGTITTTSDSWASMTFALGVASNDAIGTISAGGLSVSGQAIMAQAGALATIATGTMAVAGQSISADPAVLAAVATGAHAIAGQSVTAQAGTLAAIATGSHAVAGQTVTADPAVLGAIASGAHVIAGQAVAAQAGTLATVATGAHAVSGQAVAGLAGALATITAGELAVSGQTVLSEAAESATGVIATGTHTVSGQAVAAHAGAVGSLASGAHAVSGQSVAATAGTLGTIGTGVHAVTGQPITAEEGATPATGEVATGSLAVSGQAVAAQTGSVGAVAAGAHTVDGQSVTATTGSVGTISPQTLAVIGQIVGADVSELAAIITGVLAVSGQSVAATAGTVAAIDTGALAVAGQLITGTGLAAIVADLSGRLDIDHVLVGRLTMIALLTASLGAVDVLDDGIAVAVVVGGRVGAVPILAGRVGVET
jgi:hypothetical protein